MSFAKAMSKAQAHLPHVHARDLLSQRDFEIQQPIINELVARFERLQNKRESFRMAAQRPPLPPPSSTVSSTTSTQASASSKNATMLEKIVEVPTPSNTVPRIKHKKTKPILTMESALRDTKLRGHFRDFVEAAYAVENLNFYEAIEKYETCSSDKDKAAMAKTIVDEYVRDTSPNQVNLPSSLASKLIAAVKNNEDTSPLMAKAKHEILDLMQTNFFDKFLSVVGQPAYVADDDEESKSDDESVTFEPVETFPIVEPAPIVATPQSSKEREKPTEKARTIERTTIFTAQSGNEREKIIEKAKTMIRSKPSAAEDEGQTKLFKEWVRRTHPKTGAVYYENLKTGVTMWDMPKPIRVPPPIEPPPYF